MSKRYIVYESYNNIGILDYYRSITKSKLRINVKNYSLYKIYNCFNKITLCNYLSIHPRCAFTIIISNYQLISKNQYFRLIYLYVLLPYYH